MLKKVKKVFLLFDVLLFSLICVGCNQSTVKVNNVAASYIGTYFMGFDYFNRFDILENSKDLEILLKNDSLDKYNDSFFEEKSLLAFTYIESSQGNKSKIESYNIDGNVLSIHVETFKFGEDCAEGHWWFILELEKCEVDRIDKVEVIDSKNQNVDYNKITSLEKYIMQFNIDDEKIIWDDDTSQIVSFDKIHITLKKTNTYPEFNLEYIVLKEAINFKYKRQFPPDYFFKDEYKYLLEKFRQRLVIYLEPVSLDRLIEIIREIEKIPFVKAVYPNVFVDVC